MRGTDIMFIGSIFLIPYVLLVPREDILIYGGVYVLIELLIAGYVTYKNYITTNK